MSEQNAINKQAEEFLIRKSTGDPFVHFELTGTQDYSIGIDDSDSDKFKITDGSDPSSGTDAFTIDISGLVVRSLLATFTNGFSNAGQINTLACTNTDTTNTQSRAKVQIETFTTGGDCWFSVAISPGAKDYAIGIDNSDSDRFKISENAGNAGPSGGSEVFSINPTTRDIRFNNAYEFPTADGTAGYVLTTDGAGNVDWQPNSATGKTVQQVRTSTNTQSLTVAVIPFDNTIPQQTEGTEIFALSITPSSSSNILIFDFSGYITGATNGTIALFQDATANALFARAVEGDKSFRYYMTAGTTSSTTFKVRYGTNSAGTPIYLNRDLNGIRYGGVATTSLIITEITP